MTPIEYVVARNLAAMFGEARALEITATGDVNDWIRASLTEDLEPAPAPKPEPKPVPPAPPPKRKPKRTPLNKQLDVPENKGL